MRKTNAILTAALLVVSVSAQAAIDWANPTASTFMTRTQIDAIPAINTAAGTFWSTSMVRKDANTMFLIQDASGTGLVGTGLLEVNLTTLAGTVRATDNAIITVVDDTPTPDQDTTSLAYDSANDMVYMIDREDNDQLVSISAAGTVTNLSAANPLATDVIGNSGLVFDSGSLCYTNDTDDTVKKFVIGSSTLSTFVSTATWTGVAGGTGVGTSGGPEKFGSSMLIFNDLSFGGDDNVISVDLTSGTPTVFAPKTVFGGAAGFSNMVVFSDGTIFAWDEFGTPAAQFLVLEGSTVTRLDRATLATALGLGTATFLDPADRSSMMILTDTPTLKEVLLSVSGNGDIAKLSFAAPSTVESWDMY